MTLLPDVVMSEREARQIVYARDGGRCAICRRPGRDWSHRIARGRGGLWAPSNGILLCGSGTGRGCHAWLHQNPVCARQGGWHVTTGEHPADVPVWLNPWTLYPGWWLLDNDGCLSPVDRRDTPLLPKWAYAG